MHFEKLHTDTLTKARLGRLHTDHGTIETPIFMPVGTSATVKGIHQQELREDIKAQIILGNTYHLYMRPGMEVMEAAGGLHQQGCGAGGRVHHMQGRAPARAAQGAAGAAATEDVDLRGRGHQSIAKAH